MSRFQVTLIRPASYPHTECFREVAETVMYGLRALGHEAEIRENFFSQNFTNIVFGAHLIPKTDPIPEGTIIYNLEQHDSLAFANTLKLNLPKSFIWWDYSARNIEAVNKCGVGAFHVPIGYVPEMRQLTARDHDIDVLFYGSINARRKQILTDEKFAHIRVLPVFGIYGRERDEYIRRAKLILNIHFYESKLFEIVRASYLWANSKALVSEMSADMELGLLTACDSVPYEQLVSQCLFLLQNPKEREDVEKRGFEAFSKRDEREILQKALDGVKAAAA